MDSKHCMIVTKTVTGEGDGVVMELNLQIRLDQLHHQGTSKLFDTVLDHLNSLIKEAVVISALKE
jgi:hypothetical protein